MVNIVPGKELHTPALYLYSAPALYTPTWRWGWLKQVPVGHTFPKWSLGTLDFRLVSKQVSRFLDSRS